MPAFKAGSPCPVVHHSGRLPRTPTHFLTAIVRHAKWTGTNNESDLTGSTSLNISLSFCLYLQSPFTSVDNFSYVVTQWGTTVTVTVIACIHVAHFVLTRQLSVLFSSSGWGKKIEHLVNSCTGPDIRSSSTLLPAALLSSVSSLFHQFKVHLTDG